MGARRLRAARDGREIGGERERPGADADTAREVRLVAPLQVESIPTPGAPAPSACTTLYVPRRRPRRDSGQGRVTPLPIGHCAPSAKPSETLRSGPGRWRRRRYRRRAAAHPRIHLEGDAGRSRWKPVTRAIATPSALSCARTSSGAQPASTRTPSCWPRPPRRDAPAAQALHGHHDLGGAEPSGYARGVHRDIAPPITNAPPEAQARALVDLPEQLRPDRSCRTAPGRRRCGREPDAEEHGAVVLAAARSSCSPMRTPQRKDALGLSRAISGRARGGAALRGDAVAQRPAGLAARLYTVTAPRRRR